MRYGRFLGFLFFCSVVSCSESIGPNTDVGLRIWAEVTPTTVSISDTLAAVTIRVHVYNPTLKTVTLPGGPPYVFAGDPLNDRGTEEGFMVVNETDPSHNGPRLDYWGQNEYVFRPGRGEYTEEVIRLRPTNWINWSAVPGSYRVRAFYDGHEGASAYFTVTP